MSRYGIALKTTLTVLCLWSLAGCQPAIPSSSAIQSSQPDPQYLTASDPIPFTPKTNLGITIAAREQIGKTLSYDPAYRVLDYPNGDVPLRTGVCTDVVIRALRANGQDLQKLLHEDIRSNFSAYPNQWGLSGPDRNIDHRRVPNLEAYFSRKNTSLPISSRANDFMPGDIVSWRLSNGLPHIGIVSDRTNRAGTRLIIHNIGAGTREEDVLFAWKMVGHYRIFEH